MSGCGNNGYATVDRDSGCVDLIETGGATASARCRGTPRAARHEGRRQHSRWSCLRSRRAHPAASD